MEYKASALMAILLASVASMALVGTANAQTSSVTVQTDKPSYKAGDNIMITGEVTNVQTGQSVLIQVKDPKGALARIDPVTVAADGSWTYTFPSGGDLMKEEGDYTVIATYRGVSEETTFAFAPGLVWKIWQLEIEGKQYPIRYQITGGDVTGMTADVDLAILLVELATTSNGTLVLELPRNTIQSLSEEGVPLGGVDVEYAVFVDTIPWDIDDDEKTTSTRTLTIEFEAGTAEIEVIGTWIIPEFGAIAAIVLAVAIVGIIVATARYSKFNSFLTRH